MNPLLPLSLSLADLQRETRGGKTCKLSLLSTSLLDLPLGLSMELYEDHDRPQLINCHEESCSVKSLHPRRGQEVINLSPDERDNMLGFTVCEEKRECRSLKWMPSKIRLMGKMMNAHQTDREIQIDDSVSHEIEDQKLTSSPQFNFDTRVCAECNTTKTPLWRSGPRGPKSLCNACGIRRMKARRAAMATIAEKGPHLSAETKTKKRRRRCNNCQGQMKKRCTTSEEEKQYFQHRIRSLNRENNPPFQKTFPEEEKEAAILLMAMSYGLVHG